MAGCLLVALVSTDAAAMVDGAELQRLRHEYDERMRDVQDDHVTRVKQLAKELQAQMDAKERDFQETLNAALGTRMRRHTVLPSTR